MSAVMIDITILMLTHESSAQISLGIAFIGNAQATMELHGPDARI